MKKLPLNKIYFGDALKYMKSLPDKSVDLVVSSPPYNLGKEYEKKISLDDYLSVQKTFLEECIRLLKDTGSIFWQVGAYSNKGALYPLDVKFFPILENLEMMPINRIIWVRPHGLHARNKFSARHETVLWFAKSRNYKFNLSNIRVPQKYQNKKSWKGESKGKLTSNPDGKNPGDIWMFQNVKHNHEEQTLHPCQFPEDFISRIVLSTTDENDVVLDPFMGAGTLAVVAKNNNRNFLGAENDKKYHSISERRLSGKPDKNNSFPNLKTLRNFIDRTGKSIEEYKFDTQTAKTPSEKNKSKIFSEAHHLKNHFNRLSFEEDTFAAKLRNEELPEDPLEHNRKIKNIKKQKNLFD